MKPVSIYDIINFAVLLNKTSIFINLQIPFNFSVSKELLSTVIPKNDTVNRTKFPPDEGISRIQLRDIEFDDDKNM